jgi:5-methylcytosine-specific restriction endonuclease McrA
MQHENIESGEHGNALGGDPIKAQEDEVLLLRRRCAELECETFALTEKLSSKLYQSQNDRDGRSKFEVTLGISDLEKRIEESIFDALSAFDKKCPYCGKDHYRVGIRDKIEIDHFLPISRGGQHVPWNLLPVCKECNRKKKDRLPVDFLPASIFDRCQGYLLEVRTKYFKEGVQQQASFNYLKALLEENLEFLQQHSSHAFVRNLVQIIAPEKVVDLHRISEFVLAGPYSAESPTVSLLDFLEMQIAAEEGEFSNGVVMSPWLEVCGRLQDSAPEGSGRVTPKLLFSLLKKHGWHDVGRVASFDYSSKKHILRSPKLNGYSKSELRRMGESKRGD